MGPASTASAYPACLPGRPDAGQAGTKIVQASRVAGSQAGAGCGCLAQLDVGRLSLAGPGAQPTAGTALLPFPHFQLWPPDDSRPLKLTAVTCGWCRASQALPSLPPFSSLGLRAALVSRVRPGMGPGPVGQGRAWSQITRPSLHETRPPSPCPRVPAVIAPALSSSRRLPGP